MFPKRKKALLSIDYLSRNQIILDYLKVKDLGLSSEESEFIEAS